MARYSIVEGTTRPLDFQLLEAGAPIDLTGASIALLANDRTGAAATLGTVSIVDATTGKVRLTPANATVFDRQKAPYTVRWEITWGTGTKSYVPTDMRDVWDIVGK